MWYNMPFALGRARTYSLYHTHIKKSSEFLEKHKKNTNPKKVKLWRFCVFFVEILCFFVEILWFSTGYQQCWKNYQQLFKKLSTPVSKVINSVSKLSTITISVTICCLFTRVMFFLWFFVVGEVLLPGRKIVHPP